MKMKTVASVADRAATVVTSALQPLLCSSAWGGDHRTVAQGSLVLRFVCKACLRAFRVARGALQMVFRCSTNRGIRERCHATYHHWQLL